jgi:hypothetical protein
MQLLELIAIIVAGSLVGTELTIGILTRPRRARTHNGAGILARWFQRAMPIWYATTFILFSTVTLVLYRAGAKGWQSAFTSAWLIPLVIPIMLFNVTYDSPRAQALRRAMKRTAAESAEGLRMTQNLMRFLRMIAALCFFVAACFASA